MSASGRPAAQKDSRVSGRSKPPRQRRLTGCPPSRAISRLLLEAPLQAVVVADVALDESDAQAQVEVQYADVPFDYCLSSGLRATTVWASYCSPAHLRSNERGGTVGKTFWPRSCAPMTPQATRPKRIRWTDEQRLGLVDKAKTSGRTALTEIATIVAPDTLLRARTPRG